jgi:hypothetical protein
MPEDIQGHSPCWCEPLEVASPTTSMPSGIERRANVATIAAGHVRDAGSAQYIEQFTKRIWVAEEIAIPGGFCDAIVHAGQSTGNRADDPSVPKCSHEVLVKQMKLCRIHDGEFTGSHLSRNVVPIPRELEWGSALAATGSAPTTTCTRTGVGKGKKPSLVCTLGSAWSFKRAHSFSATGGGGEEVAWKP